MRYKRCYSQYKSFMQVSDVGRLPMTYLLRSLITFDITTALTIKFTLKTFMTEFRIQKKKEKKTA